MDMSIFEKSPRKWSNSHIQKLFLSNGQKLIFKFFLSILLKWDKLFIIMASLKLSKLHELKLRQCHYYTY